jgi:serine/threonine protein kinase
MEAIHHPNVVRVRDAVLDADEPALVMDFVAGRSVAELAGEGHAFDDAEALRVAAAVADGLATVHAAGIVHRDLKPANVLIGDDGVVRLSDFGIAVGLEDATALTAEDGVVGTLRYLAPERLAGSPATPATDVWGLGTVLFEMRTGVAAFPETTLAARVEAAAAPVSRPDGLTDATWAVLARALASDPADRYPDGAAMATALHRLPGVPAAAEVRPDPSAPTEVIALPVAAVAASPGPPPIAEPVAREPDPLPPPVTGVPRAKRPAPVSRAAVAPRKPSRSALALAGIVGALTVALVVGMAAGYPARPGPDPAAAAPTDSVMPSAGLSQPPAENSQPPSEAPNPRKDKDKGKGKGNGND